jgi:hypothetical protein
MRYLPYLPQALHSRLDYINHNIRDCAFSIAAGSSHQTLSFFGRQVIPQSGEGRIGPAEARLIGSIPEMQFSRQFRAAFVRRKRRQPSQPR